MASQTLAGKVGSFRSVGGLVLVRDPLNGPVGLAVARESASHAFALSHAAEFCTILVRRFSPISLHGSGV